MKSTVVQQASETTVERTKQIDIVLRFFLIRSTLTLYFIVSFFYYLFFFVLLGVKMEMQQDTTSADCSGLTVNSTKLDMTAAGWVCVEGDVKGVKMSMHGKEDCSDAAMTLIVAADSCIGGTIGVECGTALDSNEVTWKEYPATTGAANIGCKKGTEVGTHTFTGVDKCHLTATSSASSVALTFGVAFAGMMVTLALL